MVRAIVCAALFALALLGAAAATAAARSGISGRVGMDAACCDSQAIPATIKIQRARSGRLVRTVHAGTGRFHVRLRPGRYRLRATADSGNGAGSARVRVYRRHFTVVVVRLHSPAQ